ncbi:MAG: hypothetical protein J5883_06380 [Clostridiales bacterium]|nr:hypothetical protein [Clostridiales bacterium]
MMLFRTILTIVSVLCLLGGLGCLMYGIVSKRKGFRIAGLLVAVLFPVLFGLQFMLAVTQYSFDLSSVPAFEVTSSSLSSGVWDDEISNTSVGSNTSPELSWEEVPGASEYLVYMIDVDANYWVHMKTTTTSTSLPLGSVSSYVGPYPPSGTHEYVVYVFALREAKDGYVETLDTIGDSAEYLASCANTFENGDTGNVIAYGRLSGTFSHVD